MTTIPTTTELGPDQQRLHDTMRRLAEVTSTDAPVLSIYLDMRPEAHGESPGRRAALTVLRDRLRAIENTLEPHTTAQESVSADAARIHDFVESDDMRSVEGLAIFACSAQDLWEVQSAGVPFDTHVSAGPGADLFQLARLSDAHTSVIVAIVDTNTLRLFVSRRGALVEQPGRDEGSEEHERSDQGGWSQARYQRHIDEQDKRFAKEAAEAIERIMDSEKATAVVLAGDERAVPVLRQQLSERVLAAVAGREHIEMRAGRDEVEADVGPLLERLKSEASLTVADRVVAGVRAGDLGVAGAEPTMKALKLGQVDELVIVESAELDEELRAELIRQAALTDARVEVIDQHAGLARFGGIGATLRFRL